MAVYRRVEQNRQIVCIFEDIEAIIKEYGEAKILSYLDGEHKINKVLNIATTNYPELLDKRIVGRPRRFDRVVKIDNPSEEDRKNYFETKMDKKSSVTWAKKTEGLSFAALAELIISVKCLDKDFTETIELLRNMQDRTPSSTDSTSEMGFGEEK